MHEDGRTPDSFQGAVIFRAFVRGCLLGALAILGACSPRVLLVDAFADAIVVQGGADEDDLVLARDAGAFYLKLSESLLRESPGNLKLAESVAAGFTQYAYAFVAFEADRVEPRDARAAQKLRERAARLYRRAHRHAIEALERASPGITSSLGENPRAARVRLPDSLVGLAYWAAASWGAHISLSKDHPEIVADLPRAIRLARLAWEAEPDHADGGLASLMGTFEAARPGGSRERAISYFGQAIAAGGGRNAAPFVAKAEAIALADGDRTAFEALLREALATGANKPGLANEVMLERARWLLDAADDLF